MRVIKPGRIREYAEKHPDARAALERWLRITKAAEWSHLAELRATFPSADPVTVASGRKVVIFNIAGNAYRLITAIHYDRGKVFILRFLSHAEYDKGKWKDEL